MKKLLSFLVIVSLTVISLSGCAIFNNSDSNAPINHFIQFHDITVGLPYDFIRDSTQSDDDILVYEKGFYKKTIIIKRSDVSGDIDTALDNYVELMTGRGADSSRGKFLYVDAVMSTYYRDDVYCQEIMFVYNNSFYAFALRGGTEEEFQDLLNNINTPDTV